MSEYLLIDGTQIPVTSELAQVVGLNEAIVLQEVYYWCKVNRREKRTPHDGYYWVYNSYRGWKENHFPWWSESTIRRTFEKLEAKNLVVTGNYNKSKMDQTKWYRVNFPVLAATIKLSPFAQNEQMGLSGLNKPIPEDTYTEDVNNINKKNRFSAQNAPKNLDEFFLENDNGDDVSIASFINWYYEVYQEYRGEPHPFIRKNQKQRVIEELTNFLSEDSFLGVTYEGLQAMAEYFFEHGDSNDWRINHFANYEVLKWLFYEVLF